LTIEINEIVCMWVAIVTFRCHRYTPTSWF